MNWKWIFTICTVQIGCMFLLVAEFAQGSVKTYLVDGTGSQKEKKILVLNVIEEKEEFVGVAKDADLNVNALVYTTKFEIPPQLNIKSVRMEGGTAQLENNKLIISGYNLNYEINLVAKDGSESKLIIERTFETPKIVYEQCSRAFPELVFDASGILPFSVGMSCFVRSGKSKAIVVSLPNNASIVSSSFFDTMGKGERWRMYEIPDALTDGGLIGSISIKYQEQLYKLNLVSINLDIANNLKLIEQLQKENKTLSEKISELLKKNKNLNGERDNLAEETSLLEAMVSLFHVYFSMGNNTSKLNIEKSDYGPLAKTDSEIAVQMHTVSDPIFKNYIINGGFLTTLPMGTKTDRIDFFEAQGSIGYLIPLDKINIIPKLGGAYRNFAHQVSTMYIQAGQIGPGLGLSYTISEDNNLRLDLSSQTMGSKVIKAHSQFALAYEHRFLKPKMWWLGFRFSSQSLTVVNESGDPRKVNNTQTMVYLSL